MRTRHHPWHVYPKPRTRVFDIHSNPFGTPWQIAPGKLGLANFAGTPLGYLADPALDPLQKCRVKAMLLGAVNSVTQLRAKWDKQSIDALPGLLEETQNFALAMRALKQDQITAKLVSEWYRELPEEQKINYHRIGSFYKRYESHLRRMSGVATEEEIESLKREQAACNGKTCEDWTLKIVDGLNISFRTALTNNDLFFHKGLADIRPKDVKKLDKQDKSTVQNVHQEIRPDLIPRYLFWRLVVETVNAFKKIHSSDPEFAPCAVGAIAGMRSLMPDIEVLLERAKERRVSAPAFGNLGNVRDRMAKLGEILDDPVDHNQLVMDMSQKERRAFYKAWTDEAKGRAPKPKSTRAPRKVAEDIWVKPASELQRQLAL